jgi:hypothetical protein
MARTFGIFRINQITVSLTRIIGGSMKKHIHFSLLILGTVVFLMIMRIYTAPLTEPDHNYRNVDPQMVVNYTIGDIHMEGLHTAFIVKSSFKTFAIYFAFVIIVFAHRLFYGSSRAVNQGAATVST